MGHENYGPADAHPPALLLGQKKFFISSIGSGSPFSKVYFDQYGYKSSMSANEATLFAFEAKKWAQSHTGVGEKADMLLFKKENKKDISVTEIYDDSVLMKKMNDAYQTEIKEREEIRKKLLSKLFEGE